MNIIEIHCKLFNDLSTLDVIDRKVNAFAKQVFHCIPMANPNLSSGGSHKVFVRSSELKRKTFCQLFSDRSKFGFISRLVVSVLCLTGLSYHTIYLLEQYMSGRTIVSIKVGRLRSEPIPAVTLCYPAYASWLKMAQMSEQANIYFQEYLEQMKSNSESPSFNEIYRLSTRQFTRDSLPIVQMFDNLSIPFSWFSGESQEKKSAIYIEAGGIIQNSNGSIKYERFIDKQPIESFTQEFMAKYMRKCYTFYSHLRKKWRDVNIDLDYLQVIINRDPNWFPIHTKEPAFNSFFFSMHSPNTLPDLIQGQNFMTIKTKLQHVITFSQINTQLLPPTYDTGCAHYDLDDSNPQTPSLRSDCISHCILKDLQSLCQIDCIFQTEILLRRDLFLQNKTLRFCLNKNQECIDRQYLTLRFKCMAQCPDDCWLKYFTFGEVENEKYDSEETKLTIRHSSIPDQIIRHIPETSFISFISSFGGLMGMWLGMSVLNSFSSLLDNWYNAISKLKHRPKGLKCKTWKK